jgi:ABC-type multidrug transport system fused ATPase/permease subunit
MLQVYRSLLALLTPPERRRFYLLVVLVMIMGLVQMVSVASIIPFLAVLADPAIIERDARLAWAYSTFGFTSQNGFLIFLGCGVFAVMVLGLVVKTLSQYAMLRYATMRGYTVASRLLAGYLHQPYTWFLDRHSSELGSSILNEVGQFIAKAMVPAMRLLSQAAVVIFLVVLLVLVQPVAAVVLAGLLGGSYALIYLGVRRRLARYGSERYVANQQRFEVAGDALGGIKDVKLLGRELDFLDRFRPPAKRMAECDAASAVISDLPRNILEAVAFGAMLLFILIMLITGNNSLTDVLPVLGIYAFAGMRLFPALQQVYASFTSMRFALPTLEKLQEDMLLAPADGVILPKRTTEVMPLAQSLELRGVHYSYPRAVRPALDGLTLAFAARTTVGIIGGSGAGKTTAVDIILGLLSPQTGGLFVDGTEVTPDTLRTWQNAIGYVPQQIFLTDDTVAANIAFGVPADQIDMAAVERAARIAELHDFVMAEMPAGYVTEVGERGVRLSGGQRQRIGIARALYHDPTVLILDEATSALDNLTERAVMDAVHNLGRAKTIILIAHRLSTVESCDNIFMLEHGRVVAEGTYGDLLSSSRKFRIMAGSAEE